MDSFAISLLHAYQGLYGKNVVTQIQLRDLSTPDARKLDLFYKGMFLLLCQVLYPEDNWEKKFQEHVAFGEIVNEVLLLEPNFFGLGINLNAAIKHLRKRN